MEHNILKVIPMLSNINNSNEQFKTVLSVILFYLDISSEILGKTYLNNFGNSLIKIIKA